MSTNELPPAGWYPDPSSQADLRWWDGTVWTARVEAEVPDPPRGTGGGTGSGPADWATDWTPEWATQPAATTTAVATSYVPMQSMTVTSPGYAQPVRGSVQTWQGWGLALSPLWSVLLALPVLPSYFAAMTAQDSTDITPLLPVLFVSLLSLGLTIWLIVADTRVLRSRGYDPPWAWLLIVALVAYFAMRIARTGRGSVGMLVGYLVAGALSYVLAIAIAFWVLSQMQSTGF